MPINGQVVCTCKCLVFCCQLDR